MVEYSRLSTYSHKSITLYFLNSSFFNHGLKVWVIYYESTIIQFGVYMYIIENQGMMYRVHYRHLTVQSFGNEAGNYSEDQYERNIFPTWIGLNLISVISVHFQIIWLTGQSEYFLFILSMLNSTEIELFWPAVSLHHTGYR